MVPHTIAVPVLLARLAGELDRLGEALGTLERSGVTGLSNDRPCAIEHMQILDHATQTARALAALCHAVAQDPSSGSAPVSTAPIIDVPLSEIRDRFLGTDRPVSPPDATPSGHVEFF